MILLRPYIIAAAGRAEAQAFRSGAKHADTRDWLGVDASWDDKRVFDWEFLALSFERSRRESGQSDEWLDQAIAYARGRARGLSVTMPPNFRDGKKSAEGA